MSDMTREALEYIVELGEAHIQEVVMPDGQIQKYADKPIHLLKTEIYMAKPIEMNTLTSLVDYITNDIDFMPEKMIIQVQDPTTVFLYTKLNDQRKRENLATVKALLPDFPFNRFMDQENFCIGLQSKFVDDVDRALLLKFGGTVEAGTVAEYGDDGITQKATVKTGIASKGEAIVPNPVKLRPYRTFLEVEQPASDFIFRMKQEREGIACAIFEADGGAWKMEATKAVKEYLQEALKDYKGRFIVIS